MKSKKKKITLAIVIFAVLGLALLVFLNLPKPLMLSDAAFNLSVLSDGTYPGDCDNGLVKVAVEVKVQNHAITDVNLIKHNNGLGSKAEIITDTIVQQQSVEVDSISGATMSSKTILKAVENALSKG